MIVNKKDLEKLGNKVELEYNENCAKISELDYKINILKKNNFSSKVVIRFLIFMLAFFVQLFALPLVFDVELFTTEIISPLFFAVASSVGIIGGELYDRKQKLSEKLHDFSNAKSYRELLKEELLYSIEREKYNVSNKVLKKMNCKLRNGGMVLDSVLNDYDIVSKCESRKDIKQIEDDISILGDELSKKENILDAAIIKKVLNNYFPNLENKELDIHNIILFVLVGAFLSIDVYNLPLIFLNQWQVHILDVLLPFIIGGSVACSCELKNISDQRTTLKEITNTFEKNEYLTMKSDSFSEKLLDEICELKMNLEETKSTLYELSSNSSTDCFVQKSNNNYLEHDKELIVYGRDVLDNCDKVSDSLNSSEASGPILVKKKSDK